MRPPKPGYLEALRRRCDEVGALMRRIAHDPRHHAVRVVYEGARAQRRYQRFDLGFAQSEHLCLG